MDRQIVATFASKNRYSPLVGQGLARSGQARPGPVRFGDRLEIFDGRVEST
jgi:hypothetical protein